MPDTDEFHISSLVVLAKPASLSAVRERITGIPGAEVHGESPQGKLVVVLECDRQSRIRETIDTINGFEHVLGTFLVFHQFGEDGSCPE